MVIGRYSINGYWSLFYTRPFVVILLVAISGYFIGGHWWLFYRWPLVIILLMVIVTIVL